MLSNHNSLIKRRLTTGTSDAPAVTLGSETQFQLSNLPQMAPDGRLYYLMGVLLTLTATFTQSGGTGTRQQWDRLLRSILSTVEVSNAWHGTPIRAQDYVGSIHDIIEFVSNGYSFAAPRPAAMLAANGAYVRQLHVFLPFGFYGGEKPHHHAMPVAFFDQAVLKLTWAASTVIGTISTGCTLSSVTAAASALLLPDVEIRLPPGLEVAVYQAAAASGSEFTLQAFGDDTGLQGVETGAGMIFAGLLTSVLGQPGAFAGNQLTAFGVPWLGQLRTTHLDPYIVEALDPLRARAIGSVQDTGTASGLSDFSGGVLYQAGADQVQGLVNADLRYFPVLTPGLDFQLSKVKQINGPQPLLAEGTFSGTQSLLAIQAKRFSESARMAAIKHLLDRNIPQTMLGTDRVEWRNLVANPGRPPAPAQQRYLPQILARAA